MTDMYSKFISEAFISPIRSVLMVDDDFPTFDEILSDQNASNSSQKLSTKKNWRSNPKMLMSILEKFRGRTPPLLVDIHDGHNVDQESEQSVAAHLHQSDLLILDYQLDKTKPRDGTRAIQVLRHLMTNDHFNLVIVYTNEDLDTVFESVVIGLLPPHYQASPIELEKDVGEVIESAEDRYPDLSQTLSDNIKAAQYLHSRRFPSTYAQAMQSGKQPYSQFVEACEHANIHAKHRQHLLNYYLSEYEQKILSQMNLECSEHSFTWSTNLVKWLKADSIFIAFTKKTKGDDLLDELLVALREWNPNPSRLFLAKIRAAMNEYGAVAQTKVLKHRHAFASWYVDLMRSAESERRSHIAESVSRHSDQLMDVILPPVEDFANRLITAETHLGDIEERCQYHFKVDPSNDGDRKLAALEHNALVCSRNPAGWHLTTGHVFIMSDEYWLCLSAACDMVPAQLPNWRIKSVGQRLPFIAVKLHDQKNLPKDIHSNRYVFFRIKDHVRIFSFNPSGKANSKPHWELFLAENAGKFSPNGYDLKIWKTEGNVEAVQESENGSPELVASKYNATVISQLRYEYALNLTQKFGGFLTRVGLDFSDGIHTE